MKRRLLFLIGIFFVSVALFALQKPAFMLYNWAESSSVDLIDWLLVIWHGVRLDLTVAGYVTAIPVLICIVSTWWCGTWWKRVFQVYFILIAIVVATVFAADMALYPFWGYRIDSSVLFYLRTPKEAVASVSVWMCARQVLIAIAYGLVIYMAYLKIVIPILETKKPRFSILTTLVLLLFGVVLILPIRGGLSASTANEGRVYFSPNIFLNHAAVNPCFSLMASSLQEYDYADKYHFFDEQKRTQLVGNMIVDPELGYAVDSVNTKEILSMKRPNIILIILESFTANAIEVLGGETNVTPNLNALSQQGVMFKKVYASSFRTDRGLVATLNGYPGQPTTSIMKYPAKSQNLPSIAGKLRGEGYSTAMYYGGDIDFTNMRSYFYASGYQTVTGQDGLQFTEKKSRWGYNDALMFDYLYEQVGQMHEPFFATYLTLSSHEPFDVPYKRLADPFMNSMAFTDHCIGKFIDSLKSSPLWDNTLVVMISDHGYRYPQSIGNNSPAKQHIPMLWVGGVIKDSTDVDQITSQTDLAATLLSQLGIDASEFRFSKNLFDRRLPKRAVYSFNNGVGVIDSTGFSVWDFNSESMIESSSEGNNQWRTECGKAFIQTLMEDFDRR